MARFLFLQNYLTEYLGTLSVCSYLKSKGHQAEAAVAGSPKQIRRELARKHPDVVGLYSSIGNLTWVLSTLEEIRGGRGSGRPLTLVGGPHPTFFPEVIGDWPVDVLCRGEGEGAVADLGDRLDAGRGWDDVANLWVRGDDGKVVCNDVRPLVEDLDALPAPDRSFYRRYPFLGKASTKKFMTGRGCPYDCTYCMNRRFNDIYRGKGRIVRKRSPEHVVEEILRVRADYGLDFVRFVDDTLVMSKRWLSDFLSLYRKKVGLPFSCTMRADTADREMIRELGASGADTCFFGLETGVEGLRNAVLKKNIRNEDIERTAGWLKEEGISILTFNMLGLPGERLEDAFETVYINRRIGSDYPWCSILQPYPGTELESICREQGCLPAGVEQDGAFDHSWFRQSVIDSGEKRQIENLHKFFYLAVRVPWLEPLIRRLIRLPGNPLFHLVFKVTYGWLFTRSRRMSLFRLIGTALRLGRHY